MAEKGWGAPTWPTAVRRRRAVASRGARPAARRWTASAREPDRRAWASSMIGPTLLEYGTEEQKQRHLPPIVRGEMRWCQGYSEPGAGSDLASLADQVRGQGRPLADQRPEDLDQRRAVRRLVLLPGAHRPQGQEARGHQLRADRHAPAGRRDAADQADHRRHRRSARPSSPTRRCPRRTTWSAR